MTALIQQFVRAFFEKFISRFFVIITIGSILVTALAIWIVASMWNINSDFKALLPETSAAALAMTEVSDRVGSGSALFVVIDSPDREANREFARVYAEEMRKTDSVALAHYRNEKEFFEKNALLYMDVEDIAELRKRLKKRIRDEKKAANPLFVSLKKKKRSDNLLDADDIEQKYQDQAHEGYKDYLEADDGYSLTIVVRFVESSTDLVATNKLLEDVRALGARLEPTKYHPKMSIELGGGLVKRQAEYKSIMNDIVASVIFTVLGLFLVIGLYFRRVRAVLMVMVPLMMGIVWTLAIAFLVFGELTTVTAFISAILLGLGIDFSIHLLSGYDHERLDGHEPVEALIFTYNGIGTATVIGALTTFATFVVLSFAQFKGLSQFGTVAAIGVLCSLTAMIVVLPAMVLLAQRILPHTPKPLSDRPSLMDRLATPQMVQRMAIPSLVIAVILTGFFVSQLGKLGFQENFRRIGQIYYPWISQDQRDRVSQEWHADRDGRDAANYIRSRARDIRADADPKTFEMDRQQKDVGDKYTSAVSGKQSSTPTVMLFDEADTTARVYNHMEAAHKAGELTTIASVASIHAFMPGTLAEQQERMVEIDKIRALLDKEGTSFMTEKQKEKVLELREKLDVKPFGTRELPEWTKRLFKEAGAKAKAPAEGEEFAYEYLIYINEGIDSMKGHEARKFLDEVGKVATDTGEELRIGSQSYIYIAMLDEIQTDGVRMMLIALLIVFLILSLAFRNPLRAVIATIPLVIGGIWMFGFLAWFGIRLDFFNVIIIPVVIGIGIDDGVHFYYRYLDKGHGSVPLVLRQVGSAVLMTSVTSTIGFGGLAVTDHRGLQSIGYVAITGIACTLLATLLILPSILYLAEKRGWDVITGEKDLDG